MFCEVIKSEINSFKNCSGYACRRCSCGNRLNNDESVTQKADQKKCHESYENFRLGNGLCSGFYEINYFAENFVVLLKKL